MATIFETVQRSVPEPAGVQQVSGFVPTQVTQSPLAVAIKGVGEGIRTVDAINTQIKQEGLQGELEQGTKDFLAADEARSVVDLSAEIAQTTEDFEAGGISPQEAVTLDMMRSQLKRAETAFKNKRVTGTEFRIKMESTLKKYIAANPGIAQELRQTAGQTLGFDPTGAELKAVFALEKAGADKKDALTKASEAAMNKWSLWDRSISTEENLRLNGQRALDLEQASQSLAFAYDSANKLNMLDKVQQVQFSNQQVGLDLVSQINPQIIGILNSPKGVQQQTDLNILKSSIASQYRARYNKLSPGDIDSALAPINQRIDDAVLVASGKKTREWLDNSVETDVLTATKRITGTPLGARYVSALRMMKGVNAFPSSVQTELNDFFRDNIMGLRADALGTDGTKTPFSVSNDMTPERRDKMDSILKNDFKAIVENADPEDPADVQQFQNIILGTMIPMFADPESVRTVEFDTLIQTAGNPRFVELLKAMPNSEKVIAKLERVSSNYGTAIIQKMGEEVFDNYDPESPTPFNFIEALIGPNGEKRVQVQRDPTSGEFFFIAKPGMSPKETASGERFAKGFNSRYASRLNDAVKISAHLKGHTKYKGMIDQYIEQVPELLPFLAQVKEPDPIVVEIE